MRSFWLVIAKELRRKARSPLAPIVFLLFPIIFSLLIGVTFGSRGDGLAPIRVAFVDDDNGIVSRLLRSGLAQGNMPQRFDIQVVGMPQANRLLEKNKVSAIVHLPAGFSDSLLGGGTTEIEVVKNPAQGIYPRIVEEVMRGVAQLGEVAVRVFDAPLQEIRAASIAGGGPGDDFISRVSVTINHRIESLRRYLFPPAIRLEAAAPAQEGSETGPTPFRVAVFVLPGMAIFALLMLALSSMNDLHREAYQGTLARQVAAPIRAGAVILGKVAAIWIVSLVSILILGILVLIWAGGKVDLPGFVLLSIAFAVMATGLASAIYALFRTERAAGAFGSVFVIVLSMLGGSFIQLDMMPAFMRSIAPATPIYWANEGYRGLLFDAWGIADIAVNLMVLIVGGGVLLLIGVAVFRRRFGATR